MESWDQPLCRYMHRPIQVLWFNVEEWYLLSMLYFVGLMSSAAIWIAIVPTILMVIPAIRKKHRSYFKHWKLMLGVSNLSGYPPPISGRFSE